MPPASVPVAFAPPVAHDHTRRAARNPILDLATVLMLAWPLYGTFYPPETYFYIGDLSQQEFSKSAAMPVILLAISAVAGLSYLWLSRRVKIRHDWFAYLFVLLAFVSILRSGDPGYSINRALRLLPIVVFGVVYAQMPDRRHMLTLMVVAFLVSACCSIVMGAAFPAYGSSHYEGAYENAWRGAIAHKNAAGAVYGAGMLVTLHGLVMRWIRPSLGLATFAACLLMIVMSNSATSVSATSVALMGYVLFVALQRVRPQVRMLTMVTVLLTILAVATTLAAFPGMLFAILGRDMTFTGRTDVWSAVWLLIKAHPISGYGYGFWGLDSAAHDFVIQATGFKPAYAHDDWLELWLQIGIGGVIVIALEIATSLAKGFVAVIGRSQVELALPIALVIFVLMRSATEGQFCDPGSFGLFWLIWSAIQLRAPPPRPRATVGRNAGA